MQRIGIIGLGLMGGSLARAVHKYIPEARIAGLDENPEHIKYALNQGMIDEELSPEEMEEIEVIFVAVPVRAVLTVIDDIYHQMNREETIITDMGSTKEFLQREISERYPGLRYIGGHPMTGKETSGPQGASADLFVNKNYILLESTDPAAELLADFISRIGADVLFLGADRHDRLVSFSSHLPQLLATTLMNQYQLKEEEDSLLPMLTGQGFRDLSRIAASDYRMWVDIFMSNQDNILKDIDGLIERLELFKELIQAGRVDKIRELMVSGKEKRLELREGE